jgi:hypothetical protein
MFSLDMAFFYTSTVLSTLVHGSLVDRFGAENIRWIAFGTVVVGSIPVIGWVWFNRRVQQRRAVALSAD